MNKTFAILGTGFVFPRHIQAIQSIGGKIIEATSDPIKWGEFIKNTEAEWIVILTPSDLHYPMLLSAIAHKKKILCEKPLVLKSEQIKDLYDPHIYTVLQLRYHPGVKSLEKEIIPSERYEININISAPRSPEYWKTWKGDKARSGGILINLGIHYFDLLQYLFGEPTEFSTYFCDERLAFGHIFGKNYTCNWRIDTIKKLTRRFFEISGIKYYFKSHQDYYNELYQDLMKSKGITPEEAKKSLMICEKLYSSKGVAPSNDDITRGKNRQEFSGRT